MSWRDIMCGELRPEHVGQRLALAGWVGPRRDHGGLVFIDLRDATGLAQLVINPERAAEAAAVAHEVRNEFVLRAEGEVVGARARRRQPEPADRRGRAPGRRARDRLALRAAAVPARRGGRRRDAPPPLPLARPAPRADAAQPPALGARSSPRSAASMDEPGFVDIWTPILTQGDARGRARLPRPRPAAARHASSRCRSRRRSSSSCCMIVRVRPLLPDRDLLPGRGPARRPAVRVPPARRRDGVPDARGRSSRLLEARGAPRRSRRSAVEPPAAPVPADHLARGDGALRHRTSPTSASASRSRTRPSRRADSEFGVFADAPSVRFLDGAAGVLARGARRARGDREGVGREGARLPRLRRAGRGALADREVPLRAELVDALRPASPRPSSSPPTSRAPWRGCSAACAPISGRELGLIDTDRDELLWVTDFPLFEWDEDDRRWTFVPPSVHRSQAG